jgi:hypothetical protein
LPIRRKKDYIASLRAILTVVATIVTFVVGLMILVILERLVLG